MKRRLLSILIGLVALLCATAAFVCATGEDVTVLSADTGDLVVTADTYIDLNGHSIDGVTVADGATLYVSDSQTDDFSVADGIYGKLTEVTGSVEAMDGYMAIREGETLSFHCVDLQISTMSLRPGCAGLYYSGNFAGDEVVAGQVRSFGIALSVAAAPTELNIDALCEYSAFTGFTAGNNAANGTLLTGIMKDTNTDEENMRNAAMPVYGRAYILTADGYYFGSCISRDLQTQFEAVDALFTTLSDAQKSAVLSLYETYKPVMDQWQIPNIKDTADPIEMFVSKFTGDFMYRVGNGNAVSVGSLFAAAEGATVDTQTLNVTVTPLSGTAAGTYTAGTTWTAGKLAFSGLGIVEVTISAKDAIPVCLQLEVVEAINATSAMSATANNVVLLNNTGFSSVDVKNGYTLYGNGFKMTCTSDTPALDMGYAFVTLSNGNLDNVQIICPNFWHAALYKSNLTSEENETQVDGTRTRYYNARSAVMSSGNNTISNSYISGGRAAIYLTAGSLVLDNTTVYGGAAANIHVLPGVGNLVMRDVKLIQEPIRATAKDKTIMGMAVVLMSGDEESGVPPLTLEGELIQYAWIDEDDAQYIPEDTSMIVDEVFAQTDFVHTIDGKPSVSLGFVVIPSDDKSTGTLTVHDNRTNKDTAPYAETILDIVFVGDVKIFSYTNENGTDPAFLTMPQHTPAYNAAPLSMAYSDVNADRTLTKEYNTVTNAWEYKLVVKLDAGSYSLDFAKLQLLEQGIATEYTVVDDQGEPVDKTALIPLSVGNVSYTLTASDGRSLRFSTVCTREEILAPKLIAANYEAGLCVASTAGGTWSGAAPALEGIQIEYYSVVEGAYKTIDLSDCTPTTAGKQNETNNTWFYAAENNDFTLTLTGGQVHSSNNIYAMPVVCDGKLYFVASSTKGLVNSGNSARAVKVSYVFKDNATDEELSFSHTWSVEENKDEQYKYSDFCSGTMTKLKGSSTGCFAEGTMITLADGTRKPVEEITYGDELLAWDFHTGTYVTTVPSLIESHETGEYRVINLQFADGTVARVIVDHGFFDAAENNFVFLDEKNVDSYIGHEFVQVSENGTYRNVELIGYEITVENVAYYTIQTAFYNNCIAENMFTLTSPPEGVDGWFDYFEIGEGMQYDEEKKQAEIEKYGLYTYEDFAEYVTYEQFIAFNGPYLKILVGRGILSYEDILTLIATYVS